MGSRQGRSPRWLATGKPVEKPEPLAAAEVEAAVADGLLIARFSAVLALKNRLIVAALRDDVRFDTANAAQMAREVLEDLALEQDRNVVHAVDVIEHVGTEGGAARHEHDYKSRDLALLDARRQVYRDVAIGIRSDAADPEVVAALVEDARLRAWDEISRELTSRLDDTVRISSSVVVDDVYRRERAERMRRLREFDLWELADQHYSRRPKASRRSTPRAGRKE